MPIYEYRCKQCDERVELTQLMGSDANVCEACGGPMLRVWQVNIGTVPGAYKDSNRG